MSKDAVTFITFFSENMVAINPFLERLPNDQERSVYMDDCIQTVIDLGLSEKSLDDPHDLWFTTPYKLMIVYGKK